MLVSKRQRSNVTKPNTRTKMTYMLKTFVKIMLTFRKKRMNGPLFFMQHQPKKKVSTLKITSIIVFLSLIFEQKFGGRKSKNVQG